MHNAVCRDRSVRDRRGFPAVEYVFIAFFYGREGRYYFGVGSGFGGCHDPIRAMIRFGYCPATNHIRFAVLTVLSGPVSDLF